MALTAEALQGLAGKTFGPARFERDATGIVATLPDGRATVGFEGDAVKVSSTAQAAWPRDAERQAEIDDRVQAALSGLAAVRPELAVVAADPTSGRIDASVWLDASSTTTGSVAAAARTSTLLAAGARRAIAQIAALVVAERDLLEQARRAEQETVEAIRRMETGQTEPSPSSPPSAAGSPPAAVSAPREPAPAQADWVHVDAPAEVRHVSDHSRVVGSLHPGVWYLCKQEAENWVLVTDNAGLEGWVARALVRRQA